VSQSVSQSVSQRLGFSELSAHKQPLAFFPSFGDSHDKQKTLGLNTAIDVEMM